jgi:hypothetical protein
VSAKRASFAEWLQPFEEFVEHLWHPFARYLHGFDAAKFPWRDLVSTTARHLHEHVVEGILTSAREHLITRNRVQQNAEFRIAELRSAA